MRASLVTIAIVIGLSAVLSAPATAGDAEAEIQYLLNAVGDSGCTFTRNGTDHTADEAQDHLAMKYRRAGSRVKTADAFIERLASRSSWTGKPYLIRCGGDSMQSGAWLTERLKAYRAAAQDPSA